MALICFLILSSLPFCFPAANMQDPLPSRAHGLSFGDCREMSPAADAAVTPGVRSSIESPRPSSACSSAPAARAEAGAALQTGAGLSAGPPAGGEASSGTAALLASNDYAWLQLWPQHVKASLKVNPPWAHSRCCSAGVKQICLAATTATACGSSVRVTPLRL